MSVLKRGLVVGALAAVMFWIGNVNVSSRSLVTCTGAVAWGALPLPNDTSRLQGSAGACGLYCLAKITEVGARSTVDFVGSAQLAVTPPKGLSTRALLKLGRSGGLNLGLFVDPNHESDLYPQVLYLPRERHFIVLLDRSGWFAKIYDPRWGEARTLWAVLRRRASPFKLILRH